MAWNYENSKNRLSEERKRLDKAGFTVKKLTREMDLSNLGLTEARLVHGVHSYANIANYSEILDDPLLRRDDSKRLHRYLHVIRVEQRRIMQSVFDGDKIQVHVAKMIASGKLSPKSIGNYMQVVKMVVASAVDEQGEQIHPRKWNHEFIDMPVIQKSDQKRPAHTGEVVTKIIAATKKEKYRTLLTLCAAGGLRLGEALGIDVKNVSPDGTTINICQKAWKGQVHNFLKTINGKREIDLHSSVGAMLRKYIGETKSGLLFSSKAGKPLGQSNILRRTLHPILAELGQPKCGAHAFRRFRLTWLREKAVPKDLEHFWMGHADEEVGDLYSQLENNIRFRKEVAERIGLGFELSAPTPLIGLNGPKRTETPDVQLVASA